MASCFLGSVFIVSASMHLFNPVLFFEDLMKYQIVGAFTALGMTMVLPPVMFVCGMAVLNRAVLNRIASRRVLIGTTLVLISFLMAQGLAVFRGLRIDCGCFGISRHEVGWFSMAFTTACLFCNGVLVWDKDHEPLNTKRV